LIKKLVGMAVIALFVIALLVVPVGAKPGAIKVDADRDCNDRSTETNMIIQGETIYVWLNIDPNRAGSYVLTVSDNGVIVLGPLAVSFQQCGGDTTLGPKYRHSIGLATGALPLSSLTLTVFTSYPPGPTNVVGSDSFRLVSS
jgi:hypothetical protein